MNNFLQLKKQIKLAFTLSIIITLLVDGIIAGIAFSIDNFYILFLMLVASFVCMPIIFRLAMIGFNDKKSKLINDTLSLFLKPEEYKFSYYKALSLDDLVSLKVDDRAQFFYISSVLNAVIDNAKIESYAVNFVNLDKKHINGRVIKLQFDKDIHFSDSDVTLGIFKNLDYINKVLINNKELLLFLSGYNKNKPSRIISFEPQDFNNYENYQNRIKKEIELYQHIINLNK